MSSGFRYVVLLITVIAAGLLALPIDLYASDGPMASASDMFDMTTDDDDNGIPDDFENEFDQV